MSDWENTDCVQEFYNNAECPVETVAEAYFVRDEGMNISFNDAKEQALKKLFSHGMRERMQKDVYSKDFACNEILNLSVYREPRHEDLIKITNHLQFYKALTSEELAYLGW